VHGSVAVLHAARNLLVRLDRSALRGWHLRLLERLSQRADCRLRVETVEGAAGSLPPNAELLFRLEATIHGLPRPGLATPAAPIALSPYLDGAADAPDLVLDLSGG